ncbi:MAG TPA: ATP-binding protein [Acetobacteraceae bacterium]|nr:ATP-binding protein [Acetobacteraceae bacterium]
MPPEVGLETELRNELNRLKAEQERAVVLADVAQDELREVVRERDRLAEALAHERARSGLLQTLVERGASAQPDTKPGGRDEELRGALKELWVLSEELQAANSELTLNNRDLDRRVAERTSELEQANADLARMNAELSRRVEEETSARTTAQAKLFRAQQLEAVGQLTGGIAHDFNNLLTVVTSGLQLLSRTRDEAHRQRLSRRIEEAAWRGADLTRRLLAFARQQPLNPRPLEIARHLEGLRELLCHGMRDDISVETATTPGLWPAHADPAALELALLNLAVNARDAMPNGGRVVLGARNAPASGGVPARLGLAAGDYVELFVSDTGKGMSSEVLARVFEPFFTTKPAGKGTGLGLAQVHGFAHQSGGTARVDSTEGMGTTVSILLQRDSGMPTGVPVLPARPRAEPRPEHFSVLVVEDDDEVAAMVLDMLDQLGHRGLRVSTLPAAIAVLSGGEAVDLIFTDVLLAGGGSGLDLAREVSRRGLKLPIVLTSGFGGGMTARLTAAKLPFLRKPYTLATLDEMLRHAAESYTPEVVG